MSEFFLVFRKKQKPGLLRPLNEKLYLKHWQDWLLSLAAQDVLARPVQKLNIGGKLLFADEVVLDLSGMQEPIEGFIIIHADGYEHAIRIASECPILSLGGSVEIRLGS